MKRFSDLLRILFLALFLTCMGTSLVKADAFNENVVLEHALVAPLMEWVEARLGVRVPMLPQVMVSHTTFQRVLARQGGQWAGRPQALYVSGRVIVDRMAWRGDNVWDMSLIVHELVHHAQASMTETRWACPEAREAQAYTLQNEWLAQQDAAPFVDVAWIDHVSACPNNEVADALNQTRSAVLASIPESNLVGRAAAQG